jgi:hypothetical protein
MRLIAVFHQHPLTNVHLPKLAQRVSYTPTSGTVIDETERLIAHNLDPANTSNQLPEPQKVITWVIKACHEIGPPANMHREIVLRMLVVDFASIHTLSLAFFNVLVSLASFNPPSIPGKTYQEVLCEELVTVANSDGKPEKWTQRKYQLLTGVDSFLKEGLWLYGRPTRLSCTW